ncbi:MAG TPA: hypothetical protein VMY42_18500 [Thermoguttaceae bacterium]|nr:hypothetical protein [Thermoguttaceae bacterium]
MVLRARYDAAQTTTENARHWAMADGLSPDAAMTPDVRRTLRNRARYEVANGAYARGLVLTIAGDCAGTGPRWQLLCEGSATNRIIEQAFAQDQHWLNFRISLLDAGPRNRYVATLAETLLLKNWSIRSWLTRERRRSFARRWMKPSSGSLPRR